MFYKILDNLTAIQTTQLIIKTNATRKKKHDQTILQLQARPSYYHYSFYRCTIPLSNAMSSTIVEAEVVDAYRVELAKQKISPQQLL